MLYSVSYNSLVWFCISNYHLFSWTTDIFLANSFASLLLPPKLSRVSQMHLGHNALVGRGRWTLLFCRDISFMTKLSNVLFFWLKYLWSGRWTMRDKNVCSPLSPSGQYKWSQKSTVLFGYTFWGQCFVVFLIRLDLARCPVIELHSLGRNRPSHYCNLSVNRIEWETEVEGVNKRWIKSRRGYGSDRIVNKNRIGRKK